jgi:hypothetical protein
MELLSQDLLRRFAEVGDQEGKDAIVIAHYFNPCGAGNWYATEFDVETGEFFGYVSIFGDHNDEWGYFSLAELESYQGPLGLGIERDLYWKEKRFSQIKR